jgi:alcohol dehydrogenase (cytochrome c)
MNCRMLICLTLSGLSLLVQAAQPEVHWRTYNNGYDGQRYSPLDQINAKNVGKLKPVCEAHLGDEGTFQSGPVVIGNRMYVTTAHTVVALDAGNCRIHWQHIYTPEQNEVSKTNRGVAWLDGRVYRGTGDGRILAIDAATGKELWRVKAADPTVGEFFSSAPIAWKGVLYSGISGSDWGTRGRVMAFDVATGRELWRFNTVPKAGEPGYDSWKIPETAERGGGGTWSSYTLDTDAAELFVSVGNPAPSFSPDSRPGDNLYTESVIVLDANTGKLKWHYQFMPNDGLDLDVAAAPVLYRDSAGRKLVAVGSKDGYLYAVDRATRKLVFRTAITTVMPDPLPRPTREGIRICPGFVGGVEWNGPAFNVANNTLVVGSVDLCNIYRTGKVEYKPGMYYHGTAAEVSMDDRDIQARGWVYAIDAASGQVRWNYRAESPVIAAVTPTGGGLVFTGDVDGKLMAFDSETGRILYTHDTGSAMAGGIVTYMQGETQYLAALTGNVSRGPFFALAGSPRVILYSLNASSDVPAIVKVAKDVTDRVEPKQWKAFYGYYGAKMYLKYCASCHGGNGDGSLGPALRGVKQRKDPRSVAEIIRDPKSALMPRLFPKTLGEKEVNQVADFINAWK